MLTVGILVKHQHVTNPITAARPLSPRVKAIMGGISYGVYQLSSDMGTLQEYLNQSLYREQFKNLRPTTLEFNAKWRELANSDPGFAKEQHDFIGRTHYRTESDRLKDRGIDLSGRGRAVQDALWSTAVQFRGLTPSLFARGLEASFGKNYELSELSDKDIVMAVQDYKISNNSSLFRRSPDVWPGLIRRAKSEREDLVELARHEDLLKKRQTSTVGGINSKTTGVLANTDKTPCYPTPAIQATHCSSKHPWAWSNLVLKRVSRIDRNWIMRQLHWRSQPRLEG